MKVQKWRVWGIFVVTLFLLTQLHTSATTAAAQATRHVRSDQPAFVLLRRSQLQPPDSQSGDVLVAADLAGDNLARRMAEVLANSHSYPYFALRLHRLVKNYLAHQPGASEAARAAINEQTYGCYFCPANLSFLLWQGRGEQQLRDGAVRGNHFIYQATLPLELTDGRYAPYETMLYRDVIPPVPAPGSSLKNGSQMLASEGVIASLFYRLVTDTRLQNAYRPPSFYEPFLPPGQVVDGTQSPPAELFTPQENIYLKLFDVFAHDITWEVGRGPAPMIQLISGYAARFPDEAGVIYDLFLEVTRGVTLDPLAATRHHQPEYLAGLRQRLLSGEIHLDDNLGPPLWLTNPDFQGGYGIFRYFILHPSFNFDLNAADAADLRTVPGVSAALAERIVSTRQQQGYFRRLDDLAAIEGISPELLAHFQGIQTQMEEQLNSTETRVDDLTLASLMLTLLIGSYGVVALFQAGRLLLLAALGYGLVRGAVRLLLPATAALLPDSGFWRRTRVIGRSLGMALLAFVVSLGLYLAGITPSPLRLGLAGLGVGLLFILPGRIFNRSTPFNLWRMGGEWAACVVAFTLVGAMY